MGAAAVEVGAAGATVAAAAVEVGALGARVGAGARAEALTRVAADESAEAGEGGRSRVWALQAVTRAHRGAAARQNNASRGGRVWDRFKVACAASDERGRSLPKDA